MISEIELHVHPFFENYNLEDIIRAMDHNNINVLTLEYLNRRVFPDVERQSLNLKNNGYSVDQDDIAMRIRVGEKDFYVLRAIELGSLEPDGSRFHIIVVGSDKIKHSQSIRKIIDLSLKEDSLVIFDHPLVKTNRLWEGISRQQEEEVKKICGEYSGHLALEWNGYCIKEYWRLKEIFGGKNVNREIIKLSKTDGYNNPVVTDTDVHARKMGALKEIGRGRVRSEIDLSSGRNIIKSLKQNIFSGNYENTYQTVPLFSHFIPYFAIPYVFNRFFKRVRG